MIITNKVTIKILKSNIEHYKSVLGNEINILDVIEISPYQLTIGSNLKIDVECEICNIIKNISYRDYMKSKMNKNIYLCLLCSHNKTKITCLERYGVETTFKEAKTMEKIKNTNIERYGYENPAQSSIVKEKIKNTNISKYGFTSPLKNKYIITKMYNTNFERYGSYNLFEGDSIFRAEINNKLKYILKSEDVKIKKENTCLIRYGYKSPMQNSYIFKKTQNSLYGSKKYKNSDINYRSTYELDFLNICYKYNINISQLESGIEYEYENMNKIYFPDFYIEELNLIIEIKSSYTYYADLYKNIEKQKSCINKGYNYLFIVDKKYDEFLKFTSF